MKSLLSSTLNTRELGGYPCRGGITKKGVILRSDRICKPTEGDIEYLLSRGITTAIDLRTDLDIFYEPSGLNNERFSFHHLPIEEGGYVPATAEDIVPCYMAITRAGNMPAVFHTIAAAPQGVIFNCWAGKDRTGVVSAILLLLCGVSDPDIVENYTLTKPYSEALWKEIRAERSEEEMEVVYPLARYMEGFLRKFRRAYRTAEAYLKSIGIADDEIAAIRAKLMAG